MEFRIWLPCHTGYWWGLWSIILFSGASPFWTNIPPRFNASFVMLLERSVLVVRVSFFWSLKHSWRPGGLSKVGNCYKAVEYWPLSWKWGIDIKFSFHVPVSALLGKSEPTTTANQRAEPLNQNQILSWGVGGKNMILCHVRLWINLNFYINITKKRWQQQVFWSSAASQDSVFSQGGANR